VPTPATASDGPAGTAAASTCLVELVLSAGEFGPQAEPALRELRAALEGEHGGAEGPVLRTGMAVTQEFGKLDITLRAVVSSGDLVTGAALGAGHLRRAVDALREPGRAAEAGTALFQEQSVRAAWT
jgi:hypothetical protein